MNNNTNNANIDIDALHSFVNETYDNLSFFDLYGNSVILFICATLVVFAVFSYCKLMQSKEDVANDWINQRCKPQNMLFAGFIMKPDDKTAFQYTNENFQYCVQNILTNISGYALEPFQYMLSSLTKVFTEMTNTIQQSRTVLTGLRTNFTGFAEDILSRILNVMVPMQKMFIALMDTFQKIQGSMTASLYTMLGSYYTLQALMGAILELIVKMLMALAIIIVGLWVVPFTWPAAASMSAVFLSISVPLAVIVYFMTEVLHIKTAGIPKLRCFDELTEFTLKTGKKIPIKYLKPDDILEDGSTVTSVIKVTSAHMNMYWLRNTLVSGSHLIYYNKDKSWIRVDQHPESILTEQYDKPYLYCINTDSKRIVLNGVIFSDWNEDITNKVPHNIDNHIGLSDNTVIELKPSILYPRNTKKIKQIHIGDMLKTNSIVYGIVILRNSTYHLLTTDGNLLVNDNKNNDGKNNYRNVKDYNSNIDKYLLPLRSIPLRKV